MPEELRDQAFLRRGELGRAARRRSRSECLGTAVAGAPQPTADAPFPAAPTQRSSSGIGWLQWLFIGGGAIAGIVVIGLIISGLLLTGALGPVKSSDNALSVKVPAGWAVAHGPAAGTVLALARLKQTAGVEPHFIVGDTGQLVPLADIEGSWQTYAESGQFPIAGNLGSVTRTTVAGTSALIADFQGSKVAGELIFVDYGRKTYLIEMSSDVRAPRMSRARGPQSPIVVNDGKAALGRPPEAVTAIL